MQDLNVTIIQTKLHWEDVDANLALFDAKLEQITTASDMIVLPEMFNTGFSMNAQNLSERMDGKSINWMKEKAKLMNQVVTGSLIIEDEGKYFNRLIWMRPDGTHVHYDKRHLFRMAGEHHHFSSGSEQVVVELNGWKICLLVCYDLRFPVWSRNKGNYDAVIYIANWPERRRHAWKALLLARAIENQAYVIGVNRVGVDGKGITFSGDSAIIDSKGEYILECAPGAELINTCQLSYHELETYKTSFPVGSDGDDFEVH